MLDTRHQALLLLTSRSWKMRVFAQLNLLLTPPGKNFCKLKESAKQKLTRSLKQACLCLYHTDFFFFSWFLSMVLWKSFVCFFHGSFQTCAPGFHQCYPTPCPEAWDNSNNIWLERAWQNFGRYVTTGCFIFQFNTNPLWTWVFIWPIKKWETILYESAHFLFSRSLMCLFTGRRNWDRIYYWDIWWVSIWKDSVVSHLMCYMPSKWFSFILLVWLRTA